MVNRKTSLLLPSAYRAHNLMGCLNAMLSTLDGNGIELLMSCVEDDTLSITIAESYKADRLVIRTKDEYQNGFVWIVNELASQATGDVLALMADDLNCHEHWLMRCLDRLDRQGGGLVGFNDLSSNGDEYAAHFIVDRRFLVESMGGVLYPPQYFCWWCDREISDKAQAAGLYAWAREAIVEHRHYSFGKAAIDQTYADAMQHYDNDLWLYRTRKAANFPLDYEAML